MIYHHVSPTTFFFFGNQETPLTSSLDQQLQALLEEHGQSLHGLVEQHEVLERRQAHLTQEKISTPGDGSWQCGSADVDCEWNMSLNKCFWKETCLVMSVSVLIWW